MKTKGLRKLDPRPKLMLMAVASGLCMFAKNLWFPTCLLLILLLVLLLGGANMTVIWRRARVLFATILFLFILQSVFYGMHTSDAEPLLEISNFGLLYKEGIKLAAMLSLRLLVILFAALILIEGDTSEYLLALIQMKMPYELAFMVSVGLHFLPIMRMEAINVYRCMLMRGMQFKDIGLIQKFRAYAKLCLPIFASVLRKARELSTAMEARSFRSSPKRTYYKKLRLRAYDLAAIILCPVLFTGIFIFTEGII